MITTLELLSADIKGTKEFYTSVMELPLLSSEPGKLVFQIGQTTLIFLETSGKSPVYHFAIEIPHNKLLEAFRRMQSKTSLISMPGGYFANFLEWNAQSFYFYDNNGNLLECICRYDLPNSSALPFSSHSFLQISEIGIATAQLQALMNKLIGENQLTPFEKQPPSDSFAAIGSEEALIILAALNRPWFPTDKPAQAFYTRVILENAGKETELVFHETNCSNGQ